VKVGRDLISRVTDAVMDDVREWAKRPLEDIYPIVFLDCMVLKIREGGTVQRRALYLALGVTLEGDRDVLGMWFQETEGHHFARGEHEPARPVLEYEHQSRLAIRVDPSTRPQTRVIPLSDAALERRR